MSGFQIKLVIISIAVSLSLCAAPCQQLLSENERAVLEERIAASRYPHLKRILDKIAVVTSAPVLLPVLGVLWVLVKIERPDLPAIFAQERVGYQGKLFTIFKIRTMVNHKATALGQVLRNFHFDEIPQLFNVWQGSMSVVGPRPLSVESHEYRARMAGFEARYLVHPGMAGLAQIYCTYENTDESFEAQGQHDIEYVRRFSLATDVEILCRSVVLIPQPRSD